MKVERIEFAVQGMTCESCVNTVTEALKAVDGVKLAQVSLSEERAQVTFDAEKTSSERLKQAVERAGYETP
jgi:copper chaperone